MPEGPEPIDTRLVRRLAGILNDTGLSEIEVERDGLKIRVSRTLTAAPAAMQAMAPAPAPAAASAQAAPGAAEPQFTGEALPPGDVVKSPMVGTVYLQSQPGSPPFVKVGDSVTQGQTLLIIEAMKTMNPIPAPRGGVVRAILVEDGEPVEFGEPLAVIE